MGEHRTNLVHSLIMASPSLLRTNRPYKGRGYGHVTDLSFYSPLKYLQNG